MSNNSINFKVTVDAKDLNKLGSTVQGLLGKFQGLRGVIQGIGTHDLSRTFDGGNRGLLSMLVSANLLADAIKGIAGTSFNFLKGQLVDGMTAQVQQTNFAGSLQAQLDITYGNAKSLAKEITAMSAQAAAALPGETKDYVAIASQSFDDVAAIYQKQGKSIQEATRDFKPMLESWGVMATSNNIDGQRAGMDLNRLINGNLSIAQLRRLEIFQKNPLFLKQLEKFSKEMGIDPKNLNKIDINKRLEIVRKALEGSITPEQLNELRNSVDGQWQSWKSNLLDPTTGLFGFMRSLNFKGVAGFESFNGQNVMDALGKMMRQITDAVGILGQAFPSLGDPMMALFKLFTNLGNQVESLVNKFIDSPFVKMQKGFESLSKEYGNDKKGRTDVKKELISKGLLTYSVDWSGLISSKIIEVVKVISDAILKAPLELSNNFDMAAIGDVLGSMVANGINSLSKTLAGASIGNYSGQLADNLAVLFRNIVWGVSNMISRLGNINFSGLGQALAGVLNAITGYISKINFGDVTTVLANGFNLLLGSLTKMLSGLLGGINFNSIGSVVGNLLNSVFGMLGKINIAGALGSVGTIIAQSLNGLMKTVLGLIGSLNFTNIGFTIGKTLGDLFLGLTTLILNLLGSLNWSDVIPVIGGLISGIGQMLVGAIAGLAASILGNAPAVLMAAVGAILNTIAQFGISIGQIIAQMILIPIQLLGAAFSAVGLLIGNIYQNVTSTIVSSVQAIGSAIASLGQGFGAITSAIADVVSNVISSLKTFFTGIVDGVKGAFSSATTSVSDLVGSSITGIQNSMSEWFNGLVNAIKAKLASIPGISQALNGLGINTTASTTGAAAGAAATTPAAGTTGTAAATTPATGTTGTATGAAATTPNLSAEQAALKNQQKAAYNGLNLHRIINAYNGHSPVMTASGGYGLGSLVSAAKLESSRMPAGANLVMANSSETIIPRDKTVNLGKTNVSAPTVYVTVNVNGAGDPREVANQVISQIANSFKEYKLVNAL